MVIRHHLVFSLNIESTKHSSLWRHNCSFNYDNVGKQSLAPQKHIFWGYYFKPVIFKKYSQRTFDPLLPKGIQIEKPV